MSKIRLNRNDILSCIEEINKVDMKRKHKATITTALLLFIEEKERGIYTDGMIRNKLESIKSKLKPIGANILIEELNDVIENIAKRRYF